MTQNNESYYHHISQQFNDELEDVKAHLLEMGGKVEQQVAESIRALIEADSSLAEEVRLKDQEINCMEIAIDEECACILARRQPAASDLRLIITISKIITDLERVGDESAKIAKMAVKLTEEQGTTHGFVEIRHIGNRVRLMVQRALDSFTRLDLEMALQVAQEDKAVDIEYNSTLRQLITLMMEDPRCISRSLNIIWALRALERIGDHARNIAEYVVYLAKGLDIRHQGLKEMAKKIQKPN